ncbi:MAG: 1-acyl-sn-glycerol-3-phosphate acyltransferase [Spirochaetes bacterium]|nr:1-acyl-sn-glycerol-3-phosphate acyltransferase [Spirochaetota bacterium]
MLTGIRKLLLLFVITIVHIIQFIIVGIIHGFSIHHAAKSTMAWCRALVKNLNIAVEMNGTLPSEGVLVVSNHRSYIDIAVIGQFFPCTFLAKRELANWPILGHAARLAKVIFVDRNNTESRKISRVKISQTLKQGISVVVFPEGTSYAGPGILTFKPGTFELAADNNIAVVPVAIEYDDMLDAWVGNDTFIEHFIQTFKKPIVRVTISFGPILKNHTPQSIMYSSREWIENTLLHHRNKILIQEAIGGTL